MNGTKEALKRFEELTNDIEILLNGIENMPRPQLDCNGCVMNYDDTYLNDYDKLDEYISSTCDDIYGKYENIFSFLKINYKLEVSGKYNIEVEAKIKLDKFYDTYGELNYYNQYNN